MENNREVLIRKLFPAYHHISWKKTGEYQHCNVLHSGLIDLGNSCQIKRESCVDKHAFGPLRQLSNGYHRLCCGQLANKVLPTLHFDVAKSVAVFSYGYGFAVSGFFGKKKLRMMFFLPEISSAFIQLVIIK